MTRYEPTTVAPLPERLGHCPAGHGSLEAQRLHVAGWRTLVRGRCPECGRTFLQDMPTGHGLIYPASLDLATAEVHAQPPTPWFSEPLRTYWEAPDADPVEITTVSRRPVPDGAVLLNCLDVIYGHALLKLLNAKRHEAEGCVVIVPAALAPLVPDHVCEAWVVHVGFGRLARWLLELEDWVGERLAGTVGGLRLSPAFPHPHPSTFRLDEHLAGIEPARRGRPSIVLSLRDDRRWGPTVRTQRRNVARLVTRIRRSFPEAGFTAVGVGATASLPPDVIDLRSAVPDAEVERGWLAAMAGADLSVGVHGSNFLLPSGLAAASIELVPRDRFANLLQATLISERDPLHALVAHQAVYGDSDLGDVDGDRIGALAANLLAELPRFRQVRLGSLAGRDATPDAGDLDVAPADPDLRPSALRRGLPTVRHRVVRARQIAATTVVLGRRASARAWARRVTPPAIMTDSRGLSFELVDRAEMAAFIEHRGHFESDEIDLVARYLRPGDTAFDVGANIGHFTSAMARAAGESATHAFEPLASNRDRLGRSLELNGLGGVCVEPVAVGAAAGTIQITDYGEGYGSWATTRPRGQDPRRGPVAPAVVRDVPLVTLDEHCARHSIDHLHAVKIDVEGAELDVLEGASALLAAQSIDFLIVEASDNTLPEGRSSWELLDLLDTASLRSFVLTNGRLEAFRTAGRLDFAAVVALSAPGRARLGLP